MDNSFFQQKICSCCLKTTCYTICALYLFGGIFLFLDELTWGIREFSVAKDYLITVAFIYDISPTVMIIFSIVFLYGIYKEEPMYITQGTNMIIMSIGFLINAIVDTFAKLIFAPGYRHNLSLILILAGIQCAFVILIRIFHDNLTTKKSSNPPSPERRGSQSIYLI